MNFKRTFNEQFYLTLYKDVYESRIDPKLHYEIYGKNENRLASIQKIIEILGSNSFVKLNLTSNSQNVQILNVPWLPMRKEWGYLILQKNLKYEKKSIFNYNVILTDNMGELIITQYFIKVMKIKRFSLNASSSGTNTLIFINVGFNEK